MRNICLRIQKFTNLAGIVALFCGALYAIICIIITHWNFPQYENIVDWQTAVCSGGFSIKDDALYYAPQANQTSVCAFPVSLHNFMGIHIKAEFTEFGTFETCVVYADLYNAVENYDYDAQQFSQELSLKNTVFEGNIYTQFVPDSALLRLVVFPNTTAFALKNIEINIIPHGIILARDLFLCIGVVAAFCFLGGVLYINKHMYHSTSDTRIPTLDILKGVGVYLVIMGHLYNPEQVGQGVWDWIYSFHMPLFFMISGYLFRKKTFKSFFLNKIKTIWLPYTALYFFSIIFYTLIYPSEIASLYMIVKGYILSGSYLISSGSHNFPLWFLPHLMIASVIFFFLAKINNLKVFSLCIGVIALFTIPYQSLFSNTECILELIVLPVSITFMGIGYLFKRYENQIKTLKIDGVLFTFIGSLIAYTNRGSSVMKINSYLYFVGAVATVYGLYRIVKKNNFAVIQFAGEHSLICYGMHLIVITIYDLLKLDNLYESYTGMAFFISKVNMVFLMDIFICKCILALKTYITLSNKNLFFKHAISDKNLYRHKQQFEVEKS